MILAHRPRRETALSTALTAAISRRQTTAEQAEAEGWRSTALALLQRPDLHPADRVFVAKVLGWQKPGRDAEHRLAKLAIEYLE